MRPDDTTMHLAGFHAMRTAMENDEIRKRVKRLVDCGNALACVVGARTCLAPHDAERLSTMWADAVEDMRQIGGCGL